MVPLHEAASRGHLNCVKIMMAMSVTPLSRTKEDQTPADLARKNGFYQCARRLGILNYVIFHVDEFLKLHCFITESYKPPFPFTRKEDWYHGPISRQETERRLKEGSAKYNEDNFFLVRRSASKPGFYALSVLYSTGRVFHFEICKRGQYYYVDYGPYLESLEHVVGHYMNHADGLPAELQRPIKPPQPVIDDNFAFRTVIIRLLFCKTRLLIISIVSYRFQGKHSVHRPYQTETSVVPLHQTSLSVTPHQKTFLNALVREKL